MPFHKKIVVTSLFLSLFVFMCILAALGLSQCDVYPSYPWHLTGAIADKNLRPIADVTVVASGNVRINGLNKIFGTRVKRFHHETRTDANGNFVLNFSACDIHLEFNKQAFAEQETNFLHFPGRGDATNQVIKISLVPECKGVSP